MSIQGKVSAAAIMVGMGLSLVATDQAQATEGYFQHGYGVRHQALGGAGVADGRDSTILALNPAGIMNYEGREMNLGLSIFSPRREFNSSGNPGMTPDGIIKSGKNYFPIPDFSYSSRIDDTSAWGVAMTANGGMNTTWPNMARNPMVCGGGSGIFCGGPAGVDLMQALLSVTYAKKFDKLSIGVAPVLAMARFEATGLGAFGDFSSDRTKLTDNGHDIAFGWGFRAGLQFEMTDGVRFGAAYQSRLRMGEFDDYAGLFANQGDMDIPQSFQVGVAIDATPDITIMADYRKIYYSKVGSVGNSPSILFTGVPFGATDGPGFGWTNVDAFKVGIEWRMSSDWTLRAGFAKNDNPITPPDVTLNILAPGVITRTFTGGFEHKVSDNSSISMAVAYMPDEDVWGPDMFVPGRRIGLKMNQYAVTFGWKYGF